MLTTKESKKQSCELLAPAGSMEKLEVALHYGADAVYLGGPFGLRAHSAFTEETMAQAVKYTHDRRKKVYVTVNIFAHNRDLNGITKHLLFLREIEADGLIISDPGIIQLARQHVPDMDIHLSTQANVTNVASALFWQQQAVSRINLARELGREEIAAIAGKVAIEIELFVHGAICISYSGRCFLSHYLTGRNGNQGNCAHPCRYHYQLLEEKRPGQFFPVEEDSRGGYIFNSKDLCLLFRLPEVLALGVNSLKIEGRMKSIYYVGGIVRLYRAALDYIERQLTETATGLPPIFLAELQKLGNRGYTENFFNGPPGHQDMLHDATRTEQETFPIGIVRQAGQAPEIEIRHMIKPGVAIEHMRRQTLDGRRYTLKAIFDLEGTPVLQANPGNRVTLLTSPPLQDLEVSDLLRIAT